MTEQQRKNLMESLNCAFAFGIGDIVESTVGATATTAPASARWMGAASPEVRMVILERVVRDCSAGPQLSYYCSGWTREGGKLKGLETVADCELRLSKPFELPAPRKEE